MTFTHPQLLVLLLLLPLVWRYLTSRRPTASTLLRLAAFALAVVALSGPRVGLTGAETDVIVLVDQSASCERESGAMFRELWPLIKQGESPGDRTAVVAFGKGAVVERGFAAEGAVAAKPDDFHTASDLAAAVRLAAGMRAPGRRAAVLCLSDGLYTGDDPQAPETVSQLEALPFWYRAVGREGGMDAAAGAIVVPDEVEPRSAWVVRFGIMATQAGRVEYALSRNGVAVAMGAAEVHRGANHFFARDTADEDGLLEYRLDVTAAGDTVGRNNTSTALLRVRGAPRILVASGSDEAGFLHQALAAAAIRVDRVDAAHFPRSPAALAPYKLVVLENCRLSDFPSGSARSLADAVASGVCSLLVTGGPNSFGPGGYHRSPLDPLLPVEMELRGEKRRGAMAVAIALDRSGSMDMEAGGGRTKMDLANLGAAESIRLLAPGDQVSVIAVDSSPHIIVPLSLADNVEKLVSLTLSIQSMGGGIFCYSALKAAEEEIMKSPLANRHIVLFADAADAEEQGGCFDLVKRLNRDGVRTSVIAMGGPADVDAGFLIELARLGGGEALFSADAGGLPALFTQEIMRISRRGFLDEEATPRLLPALAQLGVARTAAPFTVGGYNVAAAREDAVVHMNLDDEFASPILATRLNGGTATGALLFEVDGQYSGTFGAWDPAPGLLVSLARRLASGLRHTEVKAYSSLDRGTAETRWEFSEETASAVRGAGAAVTWLGPAGTVLRTPLEWIEPEVAVARAVLDMPGNYLPLADLGELGTAAAPAVSLSYSTEYDLAPERDGGGVLRSLAAASGGGDGLDVSEVRRSATAAGPERTDISGYLLGLVIILFLLELAGRRLLLFP